MQQFGVAGLGGNTHGIERFLPKFLVGALNQMRFRQFLSLYEEFGRNKGDQVAWSVFGKFPVIASPLSETSTINVADIPTLKGTSQVQEYGLAVEFTDKLEQLSELKVRAIFEERLGANAGETLDYITYARCFATTNVIATGTDATNIEINRASTSYTPTQNLSKSHVRKVLSYMKANNYPARDGMFFCISDPFTLEPLMGELEDNVLKYAENAVGRIFKGEIGQYQNCKFIEQTNSINAMLPSGTYFDPTTNTNPGEAYFFGDETGIEVQVIPEEVRDGYSTDIFRKHTIGWYSILGFDPLRQDRIVKFLTLPA